MLYYYCVHFFLDMKLVCSSFWLNIQMTSMYQIAICTNKMSLFISLTERLSYLVIALV
ncbi:hypothetical protein C2G38_2121701 [Gigaspora rosea]|uniref:Uncharacterized protein n=1 Tax=Gigaspora rosea TaxID=44941 RepID=A0A397U9M7_9GLOM|nr:hypothetical protein C2G38_2121701 [Gigaspora rosea]